MIRLDHVSKTFFTRAGQVRALDDCTLRVRQGEIYGVIGYSGAGKSTLVRLINRLEAPDLGTVTVDDQELSALSKGELRAVRQKIGMIFQHFNLLGSATVFDNVAAPLHNLGQSRAEAARRVDALLERVGLSDKRQAYPGQLSGGQKQRVAIARALSCQPRILLCDEATSALDPNTTHQILDLIRDLSAELGLTVVVIAHQMEVIRALCHQVAVMDAAKIVEDGDIVSIFTSPKEAITREFIAQGERQSFFTPAGWTRPLYRLSFVGELAETPFIARMIHEYGVMPNILCGNIQKLSDTPFGSLVLDIQGENTPAAVEFLRGAGVGVEIVRPDGLAAAGLLNGAPSAEKGAYSHA